MSQINMSVVYPSIAVYIVNLWHNNGDVDPVVGGGDGGGKVSQDTVTR